MAANDETSENEPTRKPKKFDGTADSSTFAAGAAAFAARWEKKRKEDAFSSSASAAACEVTVRWVDEPDPLVRRRVAPGYLVLEGARMDVFEDDVFEDDVCEDDVCEDDDDDAFFEDAAEEDDVAALSFGRFRFPAKEKQDHETETENAEAPKKKKKNDAFVFVPRRVQPLVPRARAFGSRAARLAAARDADARGAGPSARARRRGRRRIDDGFARASARRLFVRRLRVAAVGVRAVGASARGFVRFRGHGRVLARGAPVRDAGGDAAVAFGAFGGGRLF